MQVMVTSRHFKAHESLNAYARDEVQGLTKYYDGIVSADVILSYERSRNSNKIAEVKLHVYASVLTGHAASDDFFRSIDQAIGKVKTQLQRYKDRLRRRDKAGIRKVREKV